MARRARKRVPRLALPWEREQGPFFTLPSRRRVWPLLAFVTLSGFLVIAYLLGGKRAQLKATRAALSEVESATRAFVSDIGRCPHDARELVHPPRSGVHYLSEPPLDAWGRALHLRCVDGPKPEIEVMSAGESGSFLDDDNIL
jgi:hypothetical protein